MPRLPAASSHPEWPRPPLQTGNWHCRARSLPIERLWGLEFGTLGVSLKCLPAPQPCAGWGMGDRWPPEMSCHYILSMSEALPFISLTWPRGPKVAKPALCFPPVISTQEAASGLQWYRTVLHWQLRINRGRKRKPF